MVSLRININFFPGCAQTYPRGPWLPLCTTPPQQNPHYHMTLPSKDRQSNLKNGQEIGREISPEKRHSGHQCMEISLASKKCNSKPQGDSTSYPPEVWELKPKQTTKLQKISITKEKRNLFSALLMKIHNSGANEKQSVSPLKVKHRIIKWSRNLTPRSRRIEIICQYKTCTWMFTGALFGVTKPRKQVTHLPPDKYIKCKWPCIMKQSSAVQTHEDWHMIQVGTGTLCYV